MSGGECKVKEPPPHVILGKTQVDQDWIDGEVEVGVQVCGFPRPGPRPAALDAPPATRQAPITAAPAPAKKKGIVRRLRERLAHLKPAPVQQIAPPLQQQPPIMQTPVLPPPAPPPPQDPVDALLHPRK